MSGVEEGAARCLVHPARLHSNQPVLNEIDSTDAMPPPDSIERPNEIDGVELGSIYRDRSPIDKADGDFLRLIRRPLWRGCQHE